MVGEKVDLIFAIATYSADTHRQAIKKPITSIKTFVPGAKKVGIIYNSEEPNAVFNVKNTKICLLHSRQPSVLR